MAEPQFADPVDLTGDEILAAKPVPRPYAEAIAAGAAGPGPDMLKAMGLDPASAGYDSRTKAELADLAESRGLPSAGTKATLIARLEEADTAEPEEE